MLKKLLVILNLGANVWAMDYNDSNSNLNTHTQYSDSNSNLNTHTQYSGSFDETDLNTSVISVLSGHTTYDLSKLSAQKQEAITIFDSIKHLDQLINNGTYVNAGHLQGLWQMIMGEDLLNEDRLNLQKDVYYLQFKLNIRNFNPKDQDILSFSKLSNTIDENDALTENMKQELDGYLKEKFDSFYNSKFQQDKKAFADWFLDSYNTLDKLSGDFFNGNQLLNAKIAIKSALSVYEGAKNIKSATGSHHEYKKLGTIVQQVASLNTLKNI